MSNPEQIKADLFCFKNNILIYAEAISSKHVRIVVNWNGKIVKGKNTYISRIKELKQGQDNWSDKIRELRKHYYKKYKK